MSSAAIFAPVLARKSFNPTNADFSICGFFFSSIFRRKVKFQKYIRSSKGVQSIYLVSIERFDTYRKIKGGCFSQIVSVFCFCKNFCKFNEKTGICLWVQSYTA